MSGGGDGSNVCDGGDFVYNHDNINFQTKHPNDVMEEWKKLYKMVNSLFEEVTSQNFSHTHLCKGVSGEQRTFERGRPEKERPGPDSALGEARPLAVLPQHLRPLHQRLQLGEAAQVCVEP